MTMRPNGRAVFQMELSPEFAAALETEARRQGVPVSRLVRFALEGYMDAAPCDRDVRQHRGKFKPKAAPLAGSLEAFDAMREREGLTDAAPFDEVRYEREMAAGREVKQIFADVLDRFPNVAAGLGDQ